MNKTKFILELAERTGRPSRDVREFIDDFLALTTEVLAREEEVVFLRFGRFCPRKQPACSTSVLRFALNSAKIFSKR